MPVILSMLRGINVGSHGRISMEELKTIYASLGLEDPRTYVQSGNVIFKTSERNLTRLAANISAAIEKSSGIRSDVILRTTAEWKRTIDRNPFSARPEIHPSKLLVSFLASDPGPEIRLQVLAIKTEPEELHFVGRELYIYFPNGIGRPKLSLPRIERMLKTPSTGRNWNSVTKMFALAKQLESEG